jgi:endonuclease YncB( thermonuclease family)
MVVDGAVPTGLREGARGTVTAVVDGDTLLLDTGRVVRLVGIQAPHLALGRPGLVDWPMASEARQALVEIVLGQPVRLRHGGAETDRHGRTLAHVVTAGAPHLWVQREMLVRGMARVYSFPDNRAVLPPLFAAEAAARAERVGIWADPDYRVRLAARRADFVGRAGRYELVEGRVFAAERAAGGLTFSFGRGSREDFAAVMDMRALRLFAGDGRDPSRLVGMLVRLRGWIEGEDAPRLRLTHPELIEVLASP